MALTKVSSNLVADDAIVTGKIADGGVGTADLAANAVTTAKIAQNNVTAHHIADGSVTTTQLGADAVTAAKVADDAISEEHLDKTIISDMTAVTPVAGDFVLLGDTSDSNNLKKSALTLLLNSNVDLSTKLNLSGGTMTGDLLVKPSASGATATSGTVGTFESNDNTEVSILGGSSSVLALNFGHSGDNDDANINYNTTSGSEQMAFRVNASNRLIIDSTGKVAIGHTSAVSSSTLTLNGNQSALALSRNTGTDVTWTISSDAAYMYLSDDGNSSYNMTWKNDGKVGIGTVSPEAEGLTVATAGGGPNQVVFRSNQSTATQRAGGGFASSGNSTATSRIAHLWLDADGADFGGSDYFYIGKKGNSGEVELTQQSNSPMLKPMHWLRGLKISSLMQLL